MNGRSIQTASYSWGCYADKDKYLFKNEYMLMTQKSSIAIAVFVQSSDFCVTSAALCIKGTKVTVEMSVIYLCFHLCPKNYNTNTYGSLTVWYRPGKDWNTHLSKSDFSYSTKAKRNNAFALLQFLKKKLKAFWTSSSVKWGTEHQSWQEDLASYHRTWH